MVNRVRWIVAEQDDVVVGSICVIAVFAAHIEFYMKPGIKPEALHEFLEVSMIEVVICGYVFVGVG